MLHFSIIAQNGELVFPFDQKSVLLILVFAASQNKEFINYQRASNKKQKNTLLVGTTKIKHDNFNLKIYNYLYK